MMETTSLKQSFKYFIFGIQFLVGAIVMVLELTGTRIITPFFGASLYAWASLISVTLLSLATGYFLGGIIVDQRGNFSLLMMIIGIPGLFIILIPLISSNVLKMTNILGVKGGTLASGFILFFIPILFLGMVAPFSVKLATQSLRNLGVSAGKLYAISTTGSFFGTLVTGFILMPSMGVRLIIYIAGFTLLTVSCLGFLLNRKHVYFAVFMIIIFLGCVNIYLTDGPGDSRVLYRKESGYGTLRVVDKGTSRFMLVDASTQGDVDNQTFESHYDYIYYLQALAYYRPGSTKALLIGLGAGSLPMALTHYGIITDVIEIDPHVYDAARHFFGFVPPGEVYIEDGRYIINNTGKQYDFIIIDAYAGGYIPYQLCSTEMFRKIAGILGNRGILAINCLDFIRGEHAVISASIIRTLREVFPFLHVYVSGVSDGLENHIIFASNTGLSELRFSPHDSYPTELTRRYLQKMPALKIKNPVGRGMILTDDYNPLDSMEVHHCERFRSAVLNYFGEDMLASLD